MDLPKKMIPVVGALEEVFSERAWEWAKALLIGAILAPGERTVTGDFTRDGLVFRISLPDYPPAFVHS